MQLSVMDYTSVNDGERSGNRSDSGRVCSRGGRSRRPENSHGNIPCQACVRHQSEYSGATREIWTMGPRVRISVYADSASNNFRGVAHSQVTGDVACKPAAKRGYKN